MNCNMLVIFFLVGMTLHAQYSDLSPNDLRPVGGQWEGELTYTDYSDDLSKSTLPCTMNIYWKGNKAKITTGFVEPNGKVLHDVSYLRLVKKGRVVKFNGVKYSVDSFNGANGQLQMVLIGAGRDNLRPATIRQTIALDQEKLLLTKEVKYDGESGFFVRNQYTLIRS